jgi:hypothetical protein
VELTFSIADYGSGESLVLTLDDGLLILNESAGRGSLI